MNPNFSKHPAAGGGGRGTQSSNQPHPAFMSAIFSIILAWLKLMGIRVPSEQIQKFATDYATANKPKGTKRPFEQPHVEQALAEFQRSFQPPAPSPPPTLLSTQQSQGHRQHDKSSLFSRLLAIGNSMCVARGVLIDFLKWYTSQPEIQPFADRPNEEHVQVGIEEMKRVLPYPGKDLFESIVQNGISPDTIGTSAFQQFMGLHPSNGYMWAFEECPRLRVLQGRMCIRSPQSSTSIGVFMAGFWIDDDGTIHFMKQNTNKDKLDPSHPTGVKAIVWPCRFGAFVHRPDYAYEGEQPSGHDSLYDKSGNYHGAGSAVGAIDEVEKRCSGSFVPRVHEELTYGDGEKIRKDAHYHAACQASMAKLGGISVSKCSTSVSKEATKAESDDEAAVPSASSAPSASSECPDFCKHGVFCGGQELGRCAKCDWGQ